VAPQLPGGPLIFTGQLNVGIANIHINIDLGIQGPLVNVQSKPQTQIFAAKKINDFQPTLPGMDVPQGTKSKQGVDPYQVGIYGQLARDSISGDGLELHHVPQRAPAALVIPGYDPQTAPVIALPVDEHTMITNSQADRDRSRVTKDTLIAEDIYMVMQYTGAPPESINKLLQLNQTLYP
jgi:hypothetical protein